MFLPVLICSDVLLCVIDFFVYLFLPVLILSYLSVSVLI